MGPGRTTNMLQRLVLCGLMLTLAGVIAAGCGGSSDPAAAAEGGTKPRGGTMTIGMDQEPQCLNVKIQCGSMAATSMIASSLFDGLLDVNADGDYAPKIALEVPTRENGLVKENADGTMSVTLHLDPKAAWSDGTPITCDDVAFNFTTTMDERWQVVSRKGWDQIKSVDCPDRLTVVYVFMKPYAPYLSYVSAGPLPKHVLEGKDFNSFFNEKIPVASGPFVLDHWDRSVEVVLRRNAKYWDAGEEDKPYLDKIRYVFVADTNTLKIQLRTGEVDVISPPPDSTLKQELEGFPRAKFQSEPGVYWEQIAFNNATAPTNDINVRQAIARSIDRDEIADVVLKKQVKRLDSTLLPAKEEYYLPAWSDVKADPKVAQQYLEKSGYKRSGQYYAKGGKPLTVTFKSTAGNDLRLKVAQLLQQSLKKNGIKMIIAMEPPNVLFGQSTPQGNYDLALWAWSSGIDPSQISMFTCDSIPSEANDFSGQNNYRYCNERVSELLEKSEVTTAVKERAAIVHEVQTLMAADMPLLPLFQRPETLAYTNAAIGMDNNPLGGLTWNARDWAVAK
ncbi:MAG: extracellular solute-binding protein family 5 [Thermoleophilia bacterium]|nr:extracellular solute-binding protein family 5 [Thermoleophilia bacterium]